MRNFIQQRATGAAIFSEQGRRTRCETYAKY